MTLPVVHDDRPRSPRARPRTQRRSWTVATNLVMVAGAAMLAWSGAIHLDLWESGYRRIPTIGWMFLLQAVTGLALAVAVAVRRRLVPALAGLGFLSATIGGLVWSVEWGLFGFQDSLQAPLAVESLVVEGAGIVVLAAACVLRMAYGRGHRPVGALDR